MVTLRPTSYQYSTDTTGLFCSDILMITYVVTQDIGHFLTDSLCNVLSGGAKESEGVAILSCKCISTTPIRAPIYIWLQMAIPPAPPLNVLLYSV